LGVFQPKCGVNNRKAKGSLGLCTLKKNPDCQVHSKSFTTKISILRGEPATTSPGKKTGECGVQLEKNRNCEARGPSVMEKDFSNSTTQKSLAKKSGLIATSPITGSAETVNLNTQEGV